MSVRNSALEPIESGWLELNALIDSLGPAGLTMTGPDGWAVKDHLVHIGAWERWFLALLEGKDRLEAMGAQASQRAKPIPGQSEVDAINAAVWSAHRGDSPAQALAHFRDSHALLTAALSKLTDADLQLPYNHYQPNDPRSSPEGQRPVIDWVAPNTYEHYAEHIGWINQLVSNASAPR